MADSNSSASSVLAVRELKVPVFEGGSHPASEEALLPTVLLRLTADKFRTIWLQNRSHLSRSSRF